MELKSKRTQIKLPADVKFILISLEEAGHTAYVVGGSVRNALMGYAPKDWDICTSAKPDEIEEIFKDFQILKVGKSFGTINVIISGEQYEITTYRKERGYSDGRHPDEVIFSDRVEDDLLRRDFSVNAMLLDKNSILYYLGASYFHTKVKVLAAMGLAEDRIKEDPLRILRALRFKAQYDFAFEYDLSKAIESNVSLLDTVSKERVHSELIKMASGCYFSDVLKSKASIISRVIPELEMTFDFDQRNKYHDKTVFEHICSVVDFLKGEDYHLVLAGLLHDIGKPDTCTYDAENDCCHFYGHQKRSAEIAESVLRRLKFSNKEIDRIVSLVRWHDFDIVPTKPYVRRMCNKLGIDIFSELLVLKKADILSHSELGRTARLNELYKLIEVFEEVKQEESVLKIKDLKVTGKDIIALGYSEGKIIGEILKDVHSKVLNEELMNTREELLNYIKNININVES